MKRKLPARSAAKDDWEEVEIDFTPVEIDLSISEVREILAAFRLVIDNGVHVPQWEIICKIGEIKRGIQKFSEDAADFEQSLVSKYADRDEDGNYVKNEDGNFDLSSPIYSEELRKVQRNQVKAFIPLWSLGELEWLKGKKVGEHEIAGSVVTRLFPIIKRKNEAA